MRRERDIGKNRVVKAIYLGFGFLKIRFELVIVAPTRAAMANIRGAIIYGVSSINRHMKDNK